MGHLPDPVDAGGGEFGRQRTPEQGAAAVAFAVGADEGQRIALVRPTAECRAEPGVLAPAERGEVEAEELTGVRGGGGVQPYVPRDDVGRIHPAGGRSVEVRVPSGAADQR